MKKIIWVTVLTLMLSLILTGCGHSHDWAKENCFSPKTCTVCGKIKGTPIDHDWQDATCSEPKTCLLCGMHDGMALGHNIPTNSDTNKTCATCGVLLKKTFSGNGSYNIGEIKIGEGFYKIYYNTEKKFGSAISVYSIFKGISSITGELFTYKSLVKEINADPQNEGYYCLQTAGIYSVLIGNLTGRWTITIEKAEETTDTQFEGAGVYMTDVFNASSGQWKVTHDGKGEFEVVLYTSGGEQQILKQTGTVDETVSVVLPTDGQAVLGILADGNWTITPVDP